MNQKRKQYLIATAVCVVCMFAWIFLTVALTGGRDLGDFLPQDRVIFRSFIAAELLTLAAMFFFAVKAGKLAPKPVLPPAPKLTGEKAIRRRGILILVFSWLAALSCALLGIVVKKSSPLDLHTAFLWGLAGCFGCCVLTVPVNLWLGKAYLKNQLDKPVAELQQFFLSHREAAAEAAAEKLRSIQALRRRTDVYAVSIALLALGVAFFGGAVSETSLAVLFVFVSGLFLVGALSRIRGKKGGFAYPEANLLSPQDYPALHRLAREAAEKLHYTGRIHLLVGSNWTVSIIKSGEDSYLQLGACLISLLSRDELFQIFLHEFSHISRENRQVIREDSYYSWITHDFCPNMVSSLAAVSYRLPDSIYVLQYQLYQYATSIAVETAADRATVAHGNPEVAASALLKLSFYQLFCWETETTDEACYYQATEPETHFLEDAVHAFNEAMDRRKDAWNTLLQQELPSRSDSHPILRLRLESLGVKTYALLPLDEAGAYPEERRRLLTHTQDLLRKQISETYEEDRKREYLTPFEDVTKWQQEGCPLVAETYGDLVAALRHLNRNTEAEALCDRAISQLPRPASAYAYLMKGFYLLHRYDPAGIDLIYRAMEDSSNFIDDGLEAIGAFCCLTGRQQELDDYRERALVLAQAQKDEYSELSVLSRKDRLTAEQLPEGMLEQVLSHIRSLDPGIIAQIYLVHKAISPKLSTSAFVIRFVKAADPEEQARVMHSIFRYLDTCSDWQFSLFDYQEVRQIAFDKIPGSCVYSGENGAGVAAFSSSRKPQP